MAGMKSRPARVPSAMYRTLYRSFGPQRWWPADSPFEVMVGAILTQNTSWSNVEKAIARLKRDRALAPEALLRMRPARLASLIRPAGYYNIKTARLKNFLRYFRSAYGLSVPRMARTPAPVLREELLAVSGIGPETADSMLLYALRRPVFVVDAYTIRIASRHRLIPESAGYDQAQRLFEKSLPRDARLFNEFHALLVRLGKEYCLKNNPRCRECPLGNNERYSAPEK